MAEEKEKTFTLQELSRYDGKEGRPAYFAYGGKVYDITTSGQWEDGEHHGLHSSGVDLTDALSEAPHGEDVFERFRVVGRVKT